MSGKVILKPVTMIRPSKDFIYAPSRIRPSKEITSEEFENYQGREIKVSFDSDGVSNPTMIMAYGFGLDAWYIL